MRKGLAVATLFVLLALSFFAAGLNYSYTGLDQEVRWEQDFFVSGSGGFEGATATSDGGFAIVGWTSSGYPNSLDIALVKTDANGSGQWTRVYSEPNDSMAFSVDQTTDGGYIMSGLTAIFQSDHYFSASLLLMKVDEYGDEEWNKTYAGPWRLWESFVCQTPDGGFILGGGEGINLIKAYPNGSEQWRRTYSSGGSEETFSFLQKTSDGGYVILAIAEYGFTGGYADGTYVLKVDGAGNPQWNRTFSSEENHVDNALRFIEETSDGGYILAGTSNRSELVSPSGKAWLLKLYSNGTTEWSSTYDRSSWSYARGVAQQTSDGGYIAAIYSPSFIGVRDWLWKTHANGTTAWSKLLKSTSDIKIVQQTSVGDYLLVGSTGGGFTGQLMTVSGSPPIPVLETVSALYLTSWAFLVAAIVAFIVAVVVSNKRKKPNRVEAQQRIV